MQSEIIFTNGCFDIIHVGHIELLKYCSSLGGRVIVGLNSDKSVSSLKGPQRPVNNESSRKAVLESIKYVDQVIIFGEETPLELIRTINPRIIVKGGDYKIEEVIGNDLAEVRIFRYVEGYSTTETIQHIIDR